MYKMNKSKFANRVLELRKSLGIERGKMAEMLEISYGHLNNIETGTRMPSVEIIIRLARALRVSSGYLFQFLDDDSPFQDYLDPEFYLALPTSLSSKDKRVLREIVEFKSYKDYTD